jgi:hypothetical protein
MDTPPGQTSSMTQASSKRVVGDISLFETTNEKKWEAAYQNIMEKKYKKNTRGFSKKFPGTRYDGEDPPIYLIPRERGGPSYKDIKLKSPEGNCEITPNDILFAPISKGYPMQDVSSFTLGPIVGEGLCLVNAAFSKSICVTHIQGGGRVDLKRKNFWHVNRKKIRYNINPSSDPSLFIVDGKEKKIKKWLEKHKDEWFSEWDRWRKSVALCSRGDFHWCDDSDTIIYRLSSGKYVDFVTWKKECYIRPSYKLIPDTAVFKYLERARKEHGRPLGLVHPKAQLGEKEKPITKKFIKKLFDSQHDMVCQPYVIAGKLLGVDID